MKYILIKRTTLVTMLGIMLFSILNWGETNTAFSKSAVDTFKTNLNQATTLLQEAVKYNNNVYLENPSYETFAVLEKKWDKGKPYLLKVLKSSFSTNPAYNAQLVNLGYTVTTTLHSEISGVLFVRRYESTAKDISGSMPYHTILQIKYSDGHVDLIDDTNQSLDIHSIRDTDISFYKNNSKQVLMLFSYENFRSGGWNIGLLNMSQKQRLEKITNIIPSKSMPKGIERFWDSNKKINFINICGQSSCSSEEEFKFSMEKQDEWLGSVAFGSKMINLQNVIVGKGTKSSRQKLIDQMNYLSLNGTFSGFKVGIHTLYSDVLKQYGHPFEEEGGTSFFKTFSLATDENEEESRVTWMSFNSNVTGLQGVTMGQLQQWYGVTPKKEKEGIYSVSIRVLNQGSNSLEVPYFDIEFLSDGATKPIIGLFLS
jgi:hypothetical protein